MDTGALSVRLMRREVALKVAAAVAQEALSSGTASKVAVNSESSSDRRLSRTSKLADIEAYLRHLQYDPFGGVSR